MQRTLTSLLLGLLVAVGMLGLGLWLGVQQERKKWLAKDPVIDTLVVVSWKHDTIYRTVYKPVWDTAVKYDTITIGRIVYVPFPVADATIRACEMALGSCQTARDSLVRQRDALRSRLTRALEDRQRCQFSLSSGAGAGVTYGLVHRRWDVGPTAYAGMNLFCRNLFAF